MSGKHLVIVAVLLIVAAAVMAVFVGPGQPSAGERMLRDLCAASASISAAKITIHDRGRQASIALPVNAVADVRACLCGSVYETTEALADKRSISVEMTDDQGQTWHVRIVNPAAPEGVLALMGKHSYGISGQDVVFENNRLREVLLVHANPDG